LKPKKSGKNESKICIQNNWGKYFQTLFHFFNLSKHFTALYLNIGSLNI
jgi:hypothetical protein